MAKDKQQDTPLDDGTIASVRGMASHLKVLAEANAVARSILVEAAGTQFEATSDLQRRLDLAEHSLSVRQRPMFQKLRDMKPHSLRELATTSQTEDAAEKMVGRIETKLSSQGNLHLLIDTNGDSVLLIDQRRN